MTYIVKEISHTFLETAQRCERKKEYRYVRGYQRRVKGTKLERGTWIHELLATYYQGIQQGAENPLANAWDVHKKLLKEKWDTLFDEEKEQLGADFPDTCWKIFERYVDHWQSVDAANIRKILFVEKELKVRVPWLPVPFTFKCDLVYVDRIGNVWIMDHKVVGTIPDEESRMLDNQGPRYIIGMTDLLLQKGIKVRGVGMIYDYIRDRLPAEPKMLKDGTLSKDRRIDTDYATYKAAIEKHGLDPKDYADILKHIAQNQKLFFDRWPVAKSKKRLEQERRDMQAEALKHLPAKDYYPRTLDRSRCSWDCEYKDICLLELEGGDISHLLKQDYIVKGGDGGEHGNVAHA